MMTRRFPLLNRIDVGLVLAITLTLFLSQALLKPGLPTTADLTIHLYRTLEYGQAWAPGVIVPRWSPNLAFGYGYPLFVFAPPLPYLLALALYYPGLPLETAFKILLILIPMIYAAGSYLLARHLFDSRPAGLIAAVAFTFAPFALREALLYGGKRAAISGDWPLPLAPVGRPSRRSYRPLALDSAFWPLLRRHHSQPSLSRPDFLAGVGAVFVAAGPALPAESAHRLAAAPPGRPPVDYGRAHWPGPVRLLLLPAFSRARLHPPLAEAI
jgi:hypothetical protein